MAKTQSRSKVRKIRAKNKIEPMRSRDLPATQFMLDEVRAELKSDITSVKLELKATENRLNSRFEQVDARFEQIDARFNQLDSKLENLIASVHRTNALVEQQEYRNRFALDGYTALYASVEDVKKRVTKMEEQ